MLQKLDVHLATLPLVVSTTFLMWLQGLPQHAQAYAYFADRIPNGDRVRSPCLPIIAVPAFGHKYPGGGGPRNDFGKDFADNGFQWTWALCRADSDKDGLRNGLELGDPRCEWTPGQEPSRQLRITHPGIHNWSPMCVFRFIQWMRYERSQNNRGSATADPPLAATRNGTGSFT